jgi:hypothetical protein
VHQVDLEETTSGTSLVRLLAEAEVLDRVLAEEEFGSPYWDWYDCPGSGSSEFSSELQPGCARWEKFRRLRPPCLQRCQSSCGGAAGVPAREQNAPVATGSARATSGGETYYGARPTLYAD